MRLLGLLIAVGIVMYLTVQQFKQDQGMYAIPCDILKRVVETRDAKEIDHLLLPHTRDRGVSRMAVATRGGECAEMGELTDDEAQRLWISVTQ